MQYFTLYAQAGYSNMYLFAQHDVVNVLVLSQGQLSQNKEKTAKTMWLSPYSSVVLFGMHKITLC